MAASRPADSPLVLLAPVPAPTIAPLPAALAPLVGRVTERAQVVAQLADPHLRLLTLLGPGGIGKTRLALRAAETAAEMFPDGVAFVGLAPVADPGLVLSAIGDALGVRESASRSVRDLLHAVLRDRRLLLILDNCEHLVAAAPEIAALLAACPRLVVLATSRQPLRISGEREWPVPPLSLSEKTGVRSEQNDSSPHSSLLTPHSEAVTLFVERARSVQPGFALTAENGATIEEICRRLDGLPLAIELAAARLKMLSPAALLFRLERRLPLLTRGTRDLPARLLTMRDAIAWSHDLLDSAERVLFRRLAVFAGGFTLEAAEALDGETSPRLPVFDGIASLTDKSLLAPAPLGSDDPAAERYGMLETIREYGLEQLAAHGEAAAVRARHAAWALDLARQGAQARSGPTWGDWLWRLETEHPNLRAALAYAIEIGDAPTAYDLIAHLYRFWEARGHLAEGCDWFDRAETTLGTPRTVARAAAINGTAMLWFWRGHSARAASMATESQAIGQDLGDEAQIATALSVFGNIAFDRGDLAGSWQAHEAALSLRRLAGDEHGAASSIVNLAIVHQQTGDYAAARALYDEALTLRRPANDLQIVSFALGGLGVTTHRLGEFATARAAFVEAIEIRRRLNSGLVGNFLANLAALERDDGNLGRSAALYQESVALRRARGEVRGLVEALAGLGILAASGGQPDLGVRLLTAVEILTNALSVRVVGLEREKIEQALATARRDLGPEAFTAARAAGQVLTLDAAIALAPEVAPEAPAANPAATDPSIFLDTPGGLSPRELEVLRLVATGLTDSEVGERLFISPRTVSRHLQTIYRKLEVTSRTAASAFAYDNELV